MTEDFVPMYKEARSWKDTNYNMTQLIMAYNHNSTKMANAMTEIAATSVKSANDIKWIKRFVFGISGLIGLIVFSALIAS